jgi:hypothetical protein
MFLIIQRNTNFYNEFYVYILCDFFVMLDYDEMNCNIIYGVIYSEIRILVICNNHEYDVGMNCSVKFVET